MTREEAKELSWVLYIDFKHKKALRQYQKAIDKIYDDFDISRSCEGCIDNPKKGENYPDICGECSRWYGDRYGGN